jgi:hypothetical protein
MGPERVGELKQIIIRVANDADEEAALRELGWHDHPAKAMQAAGKEMPPMVAANREAELESEIEKLRKELVAARAASKPQPPEEDYLPKPQQANSFAVAKPVETALASKPPLLPGAAKPPLPPGAVLRN